MTAYRSFDHRRSRHCGKADEHEALTSWEAPTSTEAAAWAQLGLHSRAMALRRMSSSGLGSPAAVIVPKVLAEQVVVHSKAADHPMEGLPLHVQDGAAVRHHTRRPRSLSSEV